MMARRISGHVFETPARTKYPYDEWLDGNQWILTHGQDFDCKPTTMIELLRVQATNRSKELVYERRGSTILIIEAREESQ